MVLASSGTRVAQSSVPACEWRRQRIGVIPAQAGIQCFSRLCSQIVPDPGFRRDDEDGPVL
jgi:hypothetical protein